jgi:histone acetyltransferase (RNA polymerase elongator complex component)
MKTQPARTIQFRHPEPLKKKTPVWPVFIPFAGCPFKCVYCSSYAQTGQSSMSAKETVLRMKTGITSRFRETGTPVSLGFFGGTFTAVNEQEMVLFLEEADSLKKSGAVSHIRCSTRPDCIDEKTLNTLKHYQLDMIELGVQSFDRKTLELSGRGYSAEKCLQSCRMIKNYDFELGIQLLPGLPGSGHASFTADIRTSVDIMPDAVRLYPCLVLKDTPLARMMDRGSYEPWSLGETVDALSLALLNLWMNKILVIRIGLTPEPRLIQNTLAGPWHPSMGSICRSQALKSYFFQQLENMDEKPEEIFVPEKYVSDFWGYRKMNQGEYAQKGITREMVRTWKKEIFSIS